MNRVDGFTIDATRWFDTNQAIYAERLRDKMRFDLGRAIYEERLSDYCGTWVCSATSRNDVKQLGSDNNLVGNFEALSLWGPGFEPPHGEKPTYRENIEAAAARIIERAGLECVGVRFPPPQEGLTQTFSFLLAPKGGNISYATDPRFFTP